MESSDRCAKTTSEPPSLAAALIGEQPGDQRSPSDNSSSTEMVPPVASFFGEKRQQHQLHAECNDGEH
ncbi:hypothetical protein H5410_046711 [Solanum commersonii]|uniref:Uncharacterized protein n=1 Tax=Solanum commersonii TaxID=4109 RepID=A0A9J5XF22_SOLCO|nr:hypothetical protein H5410_046711 [Solanum commersonii]